jgi:hypothetical protein
VTLTVDLWPWKSIGFQTLLRTKYVPSLVKIHWRMLILEYSQGCYVVKIWPGDLDLWPWKSIGFQILLRTKYVPSLVKIHWRMLILECSQGCFYGRTDGRTDGRKEGRKDGRGDNKHNFEILIFLWVAQKKMGDLELLNNTVLAPSFWPQRKGK